MFRVVHHAFIVIWYTIGIYISSCMLLKIIFQPLKDILGVN